MYYWITAVILGGSFLETFIIPDQTGKLLYLRQAQIWMKPKL